MTRVAVVHSVSRDGGGRARLRQWREMLAVLGIDVVELPLLAHGERIMPRGIASLGSVIGGTSPPETLAWSDRTVRNRLHQLRPDGIVTVTLRAFRPSALGTGVPVVLDYVDRLSESYRQRASIEQRQIHRASWRFLGRTMQRAEKAAANDLDVTVAAGWSDSGHLQASWLPITVPSAEQDNRRRPCLAPRWDTLFAGSLDYGPNIAAIRALAHDIWPEVIRIRPATTLCIAGRRATPEVCRLAAAMGADLVPDFSSFEEIAENATLAIAPLPLATGIQIKVLAAAAAGMPQIISPAAAAGLAPGFPVRVAEVGLPFASGIVELLEDMPTANDLGCQAREEIRCRYTTERWAGSVEDLLTRAGIDEIRRSPS